MNNESKVRDIDFPVHDWYRFVLSFPPHLVQDYIQKFNIRKSDVVLDPFVEQEQQMLNVKNMGLPLLV